MHELSICSALAAIVEEHAAGRPVAQIHLDIGHLRQVIPETLMYSWEIIVGEGPLEGSELVINHTAAQIECHQCGVVTTLEAPVFRCACGSTDTKLLSGDELLVRSLQLRGD